MIQQVKHMFHDLESAMNTRIPTRGHEARLNITLHGQNGDLVDPVPFGASDAELRRFIARRSEELSAGAG